MLNVQKFTFNPFQENTYLLYSNQSAVLIDPGMSNSAEEQLVVNFIAENNLELEATWLTHAHIDHVLGLNFAINTFKKPIYMHSLEKENLESAERVAGMYGIPFIPFGNIETIELDKISELTLGTVTLNTIFTPGHSAGSVSFYNKSNRLVISGDVLFFQSIGRTDLPGGSMDTLRETVLNKMYGLPKETIVYSGHGAETSIGFEMDNNSFFRV